MGEQVDHPLARLLLGPAGRRRHRVYMTLVGVAVYVLFAFVQHGEVLLGYIDLDQSNRLTAFYLTCAFVFYGLTRANLGERWGVEPSFAVPQMVCGLIATMGSYAITGPARGGVLTLPLLVLVFGMFVLSPRQARGLTLLAFVMFSLVMLWKVRVDPERYPPTVELIHFCFELIVLVGVTVLSTRMGAIRERLTRQKQELQAQKASLEEALERIRMLATQDDLTGLANRRHMTALLAAEQARARRHGRPLTLALLDIDLFKRINDHHGHQAGDEVLKRFAQGGRTVLRASDVLARWGGEEFLMLLPETRPEEAVECVERLRTWLAGQSFDDVAPGLGVTFSAGISMCRHDQGLDATIDAADRAMYMAKTSGRNRSVLADPPPIVLAHPQAA